MQRPHELPVGSELHLFREGIRPLWEDEGNKNGGKWVIRIKKGYATKCWEDLLLAVIGEQFEVLNELCGIVISVRYQEDIIAIWNKTATDRDAKLKLVDTLRVIFNTIPGLQADYKAHDQSIQNSNKYAKDLQDVSIDQQQDFPTTTSPQQQLNNNSNDGNNKLSTTVV